MKKKTIANAVMVMIIALIVASGVLIAGNTLGWFDSPNSETAMLTDIRGIVHMHRDGVVYTVEKSVNLRPGDVLSCEKGATANIQVNKSCVTIGESVNLTIVDSNTQTFSAEIAVGELFANGETPVDLRFDGNTIKVQNSAAHISVRTGAQTVSVFSGVVGQANAGQKLEYLSDKASVSALQIESLNNFTIACLRSANKAQSMYFTNAQLDALTDKRNQALEDILNSQTPTVPETEATTPPTQPVHTHEYTATVIPASCTAGGYTEHKCACGDSFTDSKTAATGHSWTDWVTEKKPTSNKEGTEKRSCSHCDAAETRTLGKLPAVHTHDYKKKTIAPTCTTDGYTLYTCSCGVSYKENEKSALGHQYKDKVVKPTCTKDGYTLHTCTCGDSYKDAATKATGHSWSDWKITKQPTTSQTGKQKRTCSICKTNEEQTLPKLEIVPAGNVYITIRCDTILNNMDELNPAKAEFVPADGVILPRVKVAFAQGETVFDVLARTCAAADIQLEYSWEPLYNAYYIEGINNLYHFDCGSESGWMYKVNEWFPNYGVSAYTLSDGDVIEFLYTCHGYGTDVGAPEWTE